jgi:hypothetical protein
MIGQISWPVLSRPRNKLTVVAPLDDGFVNKIIGRKVKPELKGN